MTQTKTVLYEHCDTMDIVLVFSKPFDLSKSQTCPPLGICYLASVLEQSGCRVSIVDLSITDNYSEAASAIASMNPVMVGFSCTTPGFPLAVQVAQQVKEKNPKTKIIFGGPFATFTYREILSNYLHVDVVVRREGEQTLLELAEYFVRGKNISLQSISGIAYRRNGLLMATPERPFIKNLDVLPFPARHLLGDLKKYAMDPGVISSRGCPFGCAFCSSTVMWGKRTRFRSTNNVIDEIKTLAKDLSVKRFWFVDDTFTLDRKRALRLCSQLEEMKPRLTWGCGTRADMVDEELLQAMARAGCTVVQYGIESSNSKTMKLLGKKISREEVEKKIDLAKNAGLDVYGSFIIGLPGETREMAEETIEFAESLPLSDTQINLAIPFPGTMMREELVSKCGAKIRHNNWEHYFQSYKEKSIIIDNPKLPIRSLLELYLRGKMINLRKFGAFKNFG